MKSRHINIFLISLPVLYYLFISLSYINTPGLYYDELIFVNASLGGVDTRFVYKRIWNIIIMIMPYIGALKSYIYIPIFKIFGISIESIRIPVVIISLGTVLIGYKTLKLLFNDCISFLGCTVLATDPAFIFTTRIDWGPVVLMNFLKIASLYYFIRFILSHKMKYVWIVILILSLGLFDKLNFIWYINALSIAGFIIYFETVISIIKLKKYKLLLPISLFCFITCYTFINFIYPILDSSYAILLGDKEVVVSKIDKAVDVLSQAVFTMNGGSTYKFFTGQDISYPTLIPYVTLLCIVILFAIITYMIGRGNVHDLILKFKPGLFFFLVLTIIIGQMIIIKQKCGPHHLMMIWPFHHLLFLSLFEIQNLFVNEKIKRISQSILLGFSIIIITSQVITNNNYITTFKNNEVKNLLFSTEIYKLHDYLEKNSNRVDLILSADWGFHNQLFSLTNNENRNNNLYIDFWPFIFWVHRNQANVPIGDITKYSEMLKKKKLFVLLHPEGKESLPNTRKSLFNYLHNNTSTLKREKVFYDKYGSSIYEIYFIEMK